MPDRVGPCWGHVGTVPDRAVPIQAVSACQPDTGTPLILVSARHAWHLALCIWQRDFRTFLPTLW